MTTSTGLIRQTIKIISNKRYVILDTGEIKEMNTNAKNRVDNIKTIKVTMKKLRRLISHNFTGGANQLWITLTYKENITDYKIASRDCKVFMKNIRKKYNSLDYISVIEPQENGKWHFHILLKSNQNLYIPNSIIEKAWGKGFVKTKRLKHSDKIGNYMMAYLTNIELPNSSNLNNKKYIKGARLYFYPKGIRIYRRSKGIKDPVEITDYKSKILKSNNITNKKPNFMKQTIHHTNHGDITYFTEFYDDI